MPGLRYCYLFSSKASPRLQQRLRLVTQLLRGHVQPQECSQRHRVNILLHPYTVLDASHPHVTSNVTLSPRHTKHHLCSSNGSVWSNSCCAGTSSPSSAATSRQQSSGRLPSAVRCASAAKQANKVIMMRMRRHVASQHMPLSVEYEYALRQQCRQCYGWGRSMLLGSGLLGFVYVLAGPSSQRFGVPK